MAEKPGISRAEFSKRFFGSKNRIDILGIIGQFSLDPPQQFTVADISPHTDAGDTYVRKEIDALLDTGLVTDVTEQFDRSRHFVRNDDMLWEIFQIAQEVVDVRFVD